VTAWCSLDEAARAVPDGAWLAPGAALDTVRARTGFAYASAVALHTVPDPPAHAVDVLHTLDPDQFRGALVGAGS
jgi:hypothetical protein